MRDRTRDKDSSIVTSLFRAATLAASEALRPRPVISALPEAPAPDVRRGGSRAADPAPLDRRGVDEAPRDNAPPPRAPPPVPPRRLHGPAPAPPGTDLPLRA